MHQTGCSADDLAPARHLDWDGAGQRGLIDNAWFNYVADFGNAGPDKGKSGTLIILPPCYDEARIPELEAQFPGASIYPSTTHGHWVLSRGSVVEGSAKPAVDATKKAFRVYPVSQKDDKPEMSFLNVSGKYHNTIHRMDYGIFEEINSMIQREPTEGGDPEILGRLASIGIEKGKPFAPDSRMKEILEDAANVGAVSARTLAGRARDEAWFFYPGKRRWFTAFVGGDHQFAPNGARLLDPRSAFFYYATGITPAMTAKMIGLGSQYAAAFLDASGEPFDGAKTYKVNMPAPVPAKDLRRSSSSRRNGIELDRVRARQRMERHPPSLWSAGSLVRKNRDAR